MKRSSVFGFLVAFLFIAGCKHNMDKETVAGDVSAKAVQSAPVSTETAQENKSLNKSQLQWLKKSRLLRAEL